MDKKRAREPGRRLLPAARAPRSRSDLLDELKNLGFTYATQAGFTVGIDDVRIPPEKDEIIDRARRPRSTRSTASYRSGVITDGERYNKVIDTWTHATTEVEEVTFDGLADGPRRVQPDLHDGATPARAVTASRSASSPACAA